MEERAFMACVAVLPREMRTACAAYAAGRGHAWEEIRLRAGRGLSLVGPGCEETVLLSGHPIRVSAQDLRTVLELATNSSYQSAAEQLRRGFYTMKGGHRIGVTGSIAVREGQAVAFRELSSLTIRVARAVPGAASGLEETLMENGRFQSTLLLSPPGGGKTTLLRELLVLLSDRFGQRIALADERGEVAALWKGEPQLRVGERTDVLDGCPKAEGMLMLLRSMTPQVLAVDEITARADVEAITMAANCGVAVLATAHAADTADLSRRPLYRRLLAQRVFERAIVIRREETGARRYMMESITC